MEPIDTATSERRRSERIPDSYRFGYYELRIPKREMPAFSGVTKNISSNGILFESHDEVSEGMLCKISIDIHGWTRFRTGFYKSGQPSDSMPLVVLGNVVRVITIDAEEEQYEVGIDFVNMDQGDKIALKRYFDDHRHV